MAYCSSCGSELPQAARFCPGCGAGAQTGSTPAASTQPSSKLRSPDSGCGKTAGIGCGAVIASIIFLAIVAAVINSFNQSAPVRSNHATTRASRVAHRKPAPAPTPEILLDVEGSGIKTTQRFQAPGEWAIVWSFDCSNFEGSGNFVISVDGDVSDVAANQLAANGRDVSYEHAGGNVYLEINSECDWHVRAVSQ